MLMVFSGSVWVAHLTVGIAPGRSGPICRIVNKSAEERKLRRQAGIFK